MKLFMDSSTNYLYLALYSDREINSFLRNGKNDHSETLVDVLDKFLKENNVTVDDINEIFVGRGPGSYTGVRISGTVAKVLALIKNKKLYSFSTLDLLLASKLEQGDIVVLSGDLGSGKTKFTEGFLSYWDLDDEISSPTFTIVNEHHKNDTNIYHYRLNA